MSNLDFDSIGTPPVKLVAVMIIMYAIYLVFLGESFANLTMGAILVNLLTFDLSTEPFLMPGMIAIPISIFMFMLSGWFILGIAQMVISLFPDGTVSGVVFNAAKAIIVTAVVIYLGSGLLYIIAW